MANDSRMLETKSVGIVDEEPEENELMLELSIGGIFAKSKKTIGNVSESVGKDDLEEDVHTKRVIQAIRRRELRRKREENLKESVGFGSCGSVSGPFVENKEWLENQNVGQTDEVLEIEPTRKKERIENLPENVDVASIPSAPITNGYMNPKTTPVSGGVEVARIDEDLSTKYSVFRPTGTGCRSFKPYQGDINLKPIEDEIDGGVRRNFKVNSNGSAGYASSAVSDSQCSSRQGGATDESRSNSSNSQLDHQPASTSAASEPLDRSDQPKPIGSSKPKVSAVPEPGPVNPNDRFKQPESSVSKSNPTSKPDGSSQQAAMLGRMPCVSTTGNGPNGKTISGFLYRYTKNEVSIVCVCHGESFSPAGFVEHAGGVGITHPLKHITILPAAFAS